MRFTRKIPTARRAISGKKPFFARIPNLTELSSSEAGPGWKKSLPKMAFKTFLLLGNEWRKRFFIELLTHVEGCEVEYRNVFVRPTPRGGKGRFCSSLTEIYSDKEAAATTKGNHRRYIADGSRRSQDKLGARKRGI